MLASILMPVLDEAPFLADSVAGALSQTVDVELLLVDGGSTDGSRDIARSLAAADARIRLLDNPAGTIPAGLNVGLRAARGEYVARMDAHTVYPADYVEQGVARLAQGDTGWVSGPALPEPGGWFSRCVAAALLSPLGQGGSRKWGAGAEEVELDSGVFAGVWRRETLEALGGWDERFEVSEDAQMAARYRETGGRIVCVPAMAARYTPRSTPQGLWRQYYRFGRFRARAAREHPIALRRSHLGNLGLMGALAVAPRSRAGRAVVGTWAALVVGLAPRPRAGTALALAIMHVAWGLGFVVTCMREGPPWRALASLVAPQR